MVTVPLRWDLSRHARRLLTLAVAGLGIALVTGRPEFAGAAAPALLLLSAWRPGRPPQAQVRVGLTAGRMIEGERTAVTASVTGMAEYSAAVMLHPAHEIVPLRTAPGKRPGYASGHQVRLPFLVKLSRSTRTVINQNFAFGVCFILVGWTATTTGVIGPIAAAILHVVGSLIVIFNSARLVRKGEELEHFHPETAEPPRRATGQLTPKLA